MMRALGSWTSRLALAAIVTLSACGKDNAGTVASAIVDGADRLRSSGQTQTTVLVRLPDRNPYVLVIYPPYRSAADEAFLDKIAPAALDLIPAGAAISPKSEGLLNNLVVWEKGRLATFTAAFRSAAEAKQALGIVKADGSATEITLKREGGAVYITQLR